MEITGDEHVSSKPDRWWSTNGKEDSTYMRKEGRMIQFKGLGVSGPENVSFAVIFPTLFFCTQILI